MSASILFTAALLGVAQAYTVISAPGPFMLKNIDPIVFPDQTPNDLSVYWIPTPLFTKDGGKTYEPIPVARFSAYYNLGEAPAEVAIPQNLKMVAGDAQAKTKAQVPADSKAEWFCEGGGGGALDANGFPSATCGTHLQQLLYFPSCVNEATLETAYKSRTHGTPNWCPKGMKTMPQLRFSIRYNLRKVLPQRLVRRPPPPSSSPAGPAWCSHGDFINGWTEDSARAMVPTTSSKRDFFGVNGSRGAYKAGAQCKAIDADPTRGTSDYAKSVVVMGKRSVDSAGWQSRSRLVRSE
ncbi:conserved hypothetical protein [Verticillium alfalfae VaMs.102]|uniref:DUF1996 domain-containing protein n=1 Tax=Verticillium alfalfae (strain VaMs.102 / ATCC MYA-4576 / FGSC 10136) TaxID=526221 RepID=C9S6I2_VERA1|nr:conserved hypothetical protein [Verticillium alfalfae VaMs.102]EEY14473.1 conserved hypothetical protein [Verticillium alfalfae VaMs.102]